jgi:FKBP-type peptidyl-prolyl cis-trans isomerase SlpA
MQETARTVRPESYLTLHYRLTDETGSEYVSTFELSPATLQLGCGQFAEALENSLFGLKAGERRTFCLDGGTAFGQYNPQLVEQISRDALDSGVELKENSLIQFSNAENGVEITGFLRELSATTATFDFNHPLAGKRICFEVEIIGIL